MATIHFTRKTAHQFVNDYNKALRDNVQTFYHLGQHIDLFYAYYMIEHLVNERILNGTFEKRFGKFIVNEKIK